MSVLSGEIRYVAQAFHESLPNGKSSGELTVSAGAVTFSGGGKSVSLPYVGLEVKLGGASNRLVFFSHPGYRGWSLYTSDRSVLRNPSLTAHPELGIQLGSARRTHHLAWSILVAVLLLVIAIPALLFTQMDWLTKQAARQVPPAWEQKLGKTAMAQYTLGTQLMDDKQAQELLTPLLAPLQEQLQGDRYNYHFHIANDPAINAFALPGGEVVINSGLILKAAHGNEVLGVLGHEITHVREQHGVRMVMGSTGIYLLVQTLVGDASGLLAAVASAAPMFINMGYSRDFEREADHGGVPLLANAGIDPQGLVSFFERIRAEEQKMLAKVGDDNARKAIKAGMTILGSHPATDERMANLRAQIAALPQQTWKDTDAGFAQLQAAVKTFATEDAKTAELPPTARHEEGKTDTNGEQQ